MTSAAIYARVSSARQKKDETIASQTAVLRACAERLGLEIPDEWVSNLGKYMTADSRAA